MAQGLVEGAAAFANTYWVAAVLVLVTFVPVFFLPRKRSASAHLLDERVPPLVVN